MAQTNVQHDVIVIGAGIAGRIECRPFTDQDTWAK